MGENSEKKSVGTTFANFKKSGVQVFQVSSFTKFCPNLSSADRQSRCERTSGHLRTGQRSRRRVPVPLEAEVKHLPDRRPGLEGGRGTIIVIILEKIFRSKLIIGNI